MIKPLLLKTIEVYQRFVSPFFPRRCRFYPSCSEYCRESIRKWGPAKGAWKGAVRVGKCHPLHPGGYDPVD